MAPRWKYAAVGVGVGTVALFATPVALSAAGFGTLGPVASTYASTQMSAIAIASGGGVKAGSACKGLHDTDQTGWTFPPVQVSLMSGQIKAVKLTQAQRCGGHGMRDAHPTLAVQHCRQRWSNITEALTRGIVAAHSVNDCRA
ncbi:hypothetical protein WJX73_002022 [Symbiochloris irregularis]|uniref:Uncharacterized protein n=1 Tax=Symbiochloris irregularis TaxID=706552 RepID=A0AAW1NRQ3_9CHLO